MERRLYVVENPFPPASWPSIARASAELRRPRHLHAAREAASASAPARSGPPGARAALPSRRR